MLISGVIGVLFQFVFRAGGDKQWDADRYIETVFIGLSRLANSIPVLTQRSALGSILSSLPKASRLESKPQGQESHKPCPIWAIWHRLS